LEKAEKERESHLHYDFSQPQTIVVLFDNEKADVKIMDLFQDR